MTLPYTHLLIPFCVASSSHTSPAIALTRIMGVNRQLIDALKLVHRHDAAVGMSPAFTGVIMTGSSLNVEKRRIRLALKMDIESSRALPGDTHMKAGEMEEQGRNLMNKSKFGVSGLQKRPHDSAQKSSF